MANKFTKSVLERQQKECATKIPVPDTPQAITSKKQDTDVITQAPEAMSNTSTPKNSTPPSVMPDLDSFLVQGQERSAKNKTFYLDTAVIHAIKRAAASRKLTESKLVNDILKKILAVED